MTLIRLYFCSRKNSNFPQDLHQIELQDVLQTKNDNEGKKNKNHKQWWTKKSCGFQVRLKVKEIKVTTTLVPFPTKRSTFKVSIRTRLVISKIFFFYIVLASIPNGLLKNSFHVWFSKKLRNKLEVSKKRAFVCICFWPEIRRAKRWWRTLKMDLLETKIKSKTFYVQKQKCQTHSFSANANHHGKTSLFHVCSKLSVKPRNIFGKMKTWRL